jgi:hypothetical protein
MALHKNVDDDSDNENDKDEGDENVRNDEEGNDGIYDEDDVCDSMAKGVGSSHNSPDINKHDRVKLSRNLGGMFPQEVADLGSGSPKPESLFKTYAECFVTKRTPVKKRHTGSHPSLSNVEQPNQIL